MKIFIIKENNDQIYWVTSSVKEVNEYFDCTEHYVEVWLDGVGFVHSTNSLEIFNEMYKN